MNRYAYQSPVLRLIARIVDRLGAAAYRPGQAVPDRAQRAVMFRLDQIGDAFYCTPLLDRLAERFPGIRVDVVTTARCAPVFENHPALGRIIVYDYPRFARGGHADGIGRLVSLARELRTARYDIAVDPRGEPLVALLAAFSGAPVRAGLAGEEVLSFLYTHPVRFDPASPAWHRFRGILRALGGDAPEWTPRMALTDPEIAAARERAAGLGRFVGFHLGAGVPSKRWPVERFAALAGRARARGLSVAVFGTGAEKPLADELAALAGQVTDLSGKLSLRETYALLAHAEAFVGNDSAVVHLAGPLGIPAIHLMGAASPASAVALGTGVVRVVGNDPAHRCLTDQCPYPCPHMEAITVDAVAQRLGW